MPNAGTTSSRSEHTDPIAVLGAGSVGLAMAAYLSARGYRVALYNSFADEVEQLISRGAIEATGAIEGIFPLKIVTTEIGKAVAGARLVVIAVPAFAQAAMLEKLLPHLAGIETLLLHPGAVGGAIEAYLTIRRHGANAPTLVGECVSSLFSCRRRGATQVHIRQVKLAVRAAAIPASRTPDLLAALHGPFDGRFTSASSVLQTSLDNINPVYHCPVMLANLGRVEAQEAIGFADTVTPAIVRLIEAVDAERLAIADRLGVEGVKSFAAYLDSSYGALETSLDDRIRSAYSKGGGSPLPNSINHRFLSEDVPFGLVPWSSLARLAGVATPAIDSLITLASTLVGSNWRTSGRNLAALANDEAALVQLALIGEP